MKGLYIFGFIIGLLLVGCGSDSPETLEAKKQALKEKQATLRTLTLEIDSLQAEITRLDPTAQRLKKQTPVSIEVVEKQRLAHYVEVQGKVEADNNIMVGAMSSGRLINLFVKEGQSVRKGQTLAQLDDAVIKASISEVETQLQLAEIVFKKQETLWNQEIGTEIQYLTAKNNVESLQKRLATLKEQQDMSKIKAPITGTVDEVMVKMGELVSPGFPVFRIVNPYDLKLVAEVPESNAPYIKRGDEVSIDFPILNQNLKGRVSRVGQAINPLNRTFPVEVKLPSNSAFKPNMFGKIAINDRTLDDVVAIPLSMVQKSDVGSFVYVAVDKGENVVSSRRAITLGLEAAGMVEIAQGLESGDRLITTGYKGLSDGQEVTLNEPIVKN
ncbi:MAG: efflux RND transporter periplasmic adaptor subunit [Bacteroidota bacterium]